MVLEDYGRRIDELESVLQKVVTDIPSGAFFERLPPVELWSIAKAPITLLKNLAESFREDMLVLKPEETPLIERRFDALIQPLNAFKEILFQKTTDPLANSRLALEQLRKAMVGGSEFLILAKEIRDSPSPIIKDILRLREVYEAKEYVATIRSPEAFQMRLTRLVKHVEALSASLTSLERAVNAVREHLNIIREESLKFRSAPVEPPKGSEEIPATETKGQTPVSGS